MVFKRILLVGGLVFCMLVAGGVFAAGKPGLARLANAPANAMGTSDGVATFGGAMPSSAQLDQLRGLGLQVQGFSNLPLALLRGARSAMVDAVTRGLADDVYPNDQLEYYSTSSDIAIRANEVQALGIDGYKVGVAIIDSGINATHPDLVRRVTHNVKLVETDSPAGDIIVPMDMTPYNNTDTTSGHGTHVAGIIAGDNSDGQVLGVAPGANLIGFGTGEAVFVFSTLSAFNQVIAHRDDWGIRAVNNSWGTSFNLFDPNDPTNQATKATHDAGIVVVFAAGNDTTEMSLNPYSAAPWVISVGAGSLNHQRADFSSGGLEFDDSTLVTLPTTDEKHLAFTGDRIGLYHPSLSAPGVNIVSSGTTGVAVTATPGGTASASGTSMACPHIAGVVALMLEKNPNLTPDEVKSALQVTSTLMPDTSNPAFVQPFYQSGYGFADAKAVVDLTGRRRYSANALAKMQKTSDKRVLGDRDYKVASTDYWTFTAAPATVNGTPDTKNYPVYVTSATKAIKALVSYPSLSYVGQNPFDYQITIVDAAGKTVAVSTPSPSAGVSEVFADLTTGSYTYGIWTVNLVGNLGAQDQGVIMGTLVSVAVHQLTPQVRVRPTMPTFTATGSSHLYFTPGAGGLASSPEGCGIQAPAPSGGLSATPAAGACQTGSMGYAVNYGAGIPATFTSGPLAAPLTVGGPASLKFYLTDPAQPAWTIAQNPRLDIEIDALDANGDLLLAVATGEWHVCDDTTGACNTGPQPIGATYTLTIPPVTLPAGSRLSVLLYETAAVASASRTVYGGTGVGASFSDAGVTLTTGTLQ